MSLLMALVILKDLTPTNLQIIHMLLSSEHPFNSNSCTGTQGTSSVPSRSIVVPPLFPHPVPLPGLYYFRLPKVQKDWMPSMEWSGELK